MTATVVRFLAIALTGLALIPAGAHAMEYLNKIQLPAQNYLIVQGNYRGWSLAAVLVVGAFAATLALSVVLCRRPGFLSAVIACACIVGTQIVFWTFTQPANVATHNWTMLPENWEHLRMQWELSHLASALLNAIGFFAATIAVLRSARM